VFGVSLPEIILVLAVILIVFGPEKLPEGARSMGKFFAYLKRNTDEVRREFYNSVYVPAKDLRDQMNSSLKGVRNVKGKILSEMGQDSSQSNSQSGSQKDSDE
jgi:TatA/E family protein of Tat protein translocase